MGTLLEQKCSWCKAGLRFYSSFSTYNKGTCNDFATINVSMNCLISAFVRWLFYVLPSLSLHSHPIEEPIVRSHQCVLNDHNQCLEILQILSQKLLKHQKKEKKEKGITPPRLHYRKRVTFLSTSGRVVIHQLKIIASYNCLGGGASSGKAGQHLGKGKSLII